MSIKLQAAAVGIGLLLVFSLIGGVMAYEQVPEGHEGVEKNWGAVSGNTLDPGANWVVPVMTSVQNVETRPRTYTMSQSVGEGAKTQADAIAVKTINGTTVHIDLTVRYRVDEDRADQFVEDWNNEEQMEKRLIRPTIRSDLRDEASSVQTSEIYTREGRVALTETAQESLEQEFEGEPIILEDVQVRNIDLPDSIDARLDEKEEAKQQVAIEQEKVKQEEAKKEQQLVRAEADAEEAVIAAEADAEATRIRGEALDNHPIVLQQQYIEALENGETIYVGAEGIALTKEVEDGEDDGGN